MQSIATLFLDTHISIGGVVIDQFEDDVSPLIDSSLELAEGKWYTRIHGYCLGVYHVSTYLF